MNGFGFAPETPPDIEMLLTKANDYREKSPLEALRLNEDALHYAELSKDKNLWYRCLVDLGQSHMRLGHYPQALTLAKKASDYKLSAELHYFFGIIYRHAGDFAQALFHYLETLKFLEQKQDKMLRYSTLSQIAFIYNVQGEYDLELKVYGEILEGTKPEDSYKLAALYNNMAMAYLGLRNFAKALEYAQMAYKLGKAEDFQPLVSNASCTIGEILLEAGQASRALRYLQHSQKLAHQIGATEIELYANKLLGKCHLALKDTSKALSHLESALSLSRKINMKLEQSLCHKEIAETYKSLGEYQKALAHFEKFHHLDKEIFNEQSDRNLKQLQLLISDKSK